MKRVLTAAALLPAVTWVVWFAHPILFQLVTAAVALFCFLEYAHLAQAHGMGVSRPLGIAAGLLLLAAPASHPVLLTVAVLAALALSMRNAGLAKVLPAAAALALGVLYCFGPWRCAIDLRNLGPHWLFYAMAVNWIGDMAAYFVGKRFGKRKMSPLISPGKTWEGALASLAASVLFGCLFLHRFAPETGLPEVILLSILANLAGQLGDLCESALKRGAGVKDSGAMLPGHGGWLDRLDASLFTLPVVYLWLARSSFTL